MTTQKYSNVSVTFHLLLAITAITAILFLASLLFSETKIAEAKSPNLNEIIKSDNLSEKSKVHDRKKLTAPKLYPKYPDKLVWTWHHKDPYKWNVYISTNNGATFFLISDYWMYGDARVFAPDGGGELMFIVGIDESGNEITARSNIVRPEDAPVPK